MDLTITGVIKNIPPNSSLKFDMLIPIKNLGDEILESWSREAPGYVFLEENVSIENLRTKIAGTTNHYHTRLENNIKDDLLPLTRFHLYGHGSIGPILYIYIFAAIALVILLVACMNFINFITAKASARSKEIGIRKVVGAGKQHILYFQKIVY